MANVMVGAAQIKRLCFREQICKANERSRTHFHSHPDLGNLAVDPKLSEDFYRAMATDTAQRTQQCIGEWLTPHFTFFVEICASRLFGESVRLALGRLFGRAVSQFNVVPASVLVLGWEGEVSSTMHGFRMRYVFEDVVVDRRRAFTMYTYILHEALRSENDLLRKALVGEVHDEEDLRRCISRDPYISMSSGERTLTMLGSIGMGPCPERESAVGRMHSKCPLCLGERRVPRTMPLALLHVLDAEGQELEDASKVDAVEALRRTSLRTARQLSASYVEPAGGPAVPMEETKRQGLVISDVFRAERGAQGGKNSIRVDDEAVLRTLECIVRRHAPQYGELRVRRAFRCGGSGDSRFYRVHPHGFNDTYCLNIGSNHRFNDRAQSQGWAGRIGFVVSAAGAKMVCYCREPLDPRSGKMPCKDYHQRQDLHPLSVAEKEVLGFFCRPREGGSGPATHQLLYTILPRLHAELTGTADPAPKKRRR